jgi:hypothetical protein
MNAEVINLSLYRPVQPPKVVAATAAHERTEATASHVLALQTIRDLYRTACLGLESSRQALGMIARSGGNPEVARLAAKLVQELEWRNVVAPCDSETGGGDAA